MRTLVVSDLHIGAAKRTDLLRRPELREPLLEAIADADRLVILGDGIELRDTPQRDAAGLAGAFLEQAARALPSGGEIVLTAGNHDHGLVAGWIDGRLMTEASGFLGLEERIAPQDAGPLAAMLAERVAPTPLSIVYPGLWLRDDVYALHGHYADVHTTVPTFERLAAGAMARYVVRLPEDGAAPDDYEAVLAPIYAWMHALTQRSERAVMSAGASASARTYTALTGRARHEHPLRTMAFGAGYLAAVAAVNAAGIGPLQRSLSGAALRRGYLHGISEVVRRLGIGARHVIWGHSHRSGPWPGDDASEWVTATGAGILNTGSWVYQPHFLTGTPYGSPYWPGTAVVVEDAGPPRLIRLLGSRGHAELRPPG